MKIMAFYIVALYAAGTAYPHKRLGYDEQPEGRRQPVKDTVYFTIDDGPSENTAFIDSIVSAEKTPVTVFLVGRNMPSGLGGPYYENPYVKIGNHSFSHADGHYRRFYRNPLRVRADFEQNALVIHGTNRIARLPGRNTWRVAERRQTDLKDANASADALAAEGFVVFGWDLEWCYSDSLHTQIRPAASLVQQLRYMAMEQNSFTRHHIVILCHEAMFTTPPARAALVDFLQYMKRSNEFELGWLKHYPGYR